jgi:hypothetical protein
MYVCTHTHTHTYRNTYIHTYIHTYIQVVGLTATIGGAASVAKSEERIYDLLVRLNNAKILTEQNLSKEAFQELHELRPDVADTKITVQMSEVEAWFAEKSKKLADLVQQQMDRGVKGTPEGVLYEDFFNLLQEAKRVCDDSGAYEALSFLAESYLALIYAPSSRKR